jgi:HPt (histidine-containing phosphotransfer) domain-containing protein
VHDVSEPSFELDEALAQAGSEELLRELVDILLGEGSKELATAGSAQTNGDATGLEAAAHRLRGAVIIFGAKRLGAALGEVERLARSGAIAGCASSLERAESEWHVLAGELEAWRSGAATDLVEGRQNSV